MSHAHADGMVHLLLRGEPTDAKADARVGHVLLHAQCAEHVGGLETLGGARGAAGDGNVFEGHDEAFSLHKGEADVEVALVALLDVTIDANVGDVLHEGRAQLLREAGHVRRVALHLLPGDPARGTKARDEGVGQCPRTHPPLLTASVHHWLKAHTRPPAHVERANTLGPVDLVPRHGHEVHVPPVHIHGDFAECLRRVCVKEDLLGAADAANLLHGLEHADLVVHGHDAH
mmetsp:Transcript_12229/g.32800  ORF Transcript_12229/g.32800 Transcript_12229/m.32800 type:complete len:231 (-) Transcript_12229:586-1278(-)